MKNVPAKVERRGALSRIEEDDALSRTLNAFESETLGVLARTSPKHERVTLQVLVIMVVVIIVLAAVVKLDRVVSGTGKIVSVGGPIYVSPLIAGVIKEVLVKPGEVVQKGQTLAIMDPVSAQADADASQKKLLSDDAAIERYTAEYHDQHYAPTGDNPNNADQLSIWEQRQAEYKANVGAYDSQIAAAHGLGEQYRQDAEQYRKRYELALRRQAMVEPLIAKGYVSELQLNTAKDSSEELSRQYADATKQVQQQVSTEMSTRQQRAAYVQKWHSDVGTQLVSYRNDRDATEQALIKAQKAVEQNTLVAPAQAIVLKIANVSKGSVAGVGANTTDLANPQLITLVPLDAPLEAEIDINTPDVSFIRAGDPVMIKLDAYSYIRHGVAKGTIKSISDGSFTVDDNNQPTNPYFKVKVAITEVKLQGVPGDFHLVPGQTLIGDAHIGQRTILSYMIEGAMRTGSEAMREAQ